jgi:hypothetical protein
MPLRGRAAGNGSRTSPSEPGRGYQHGFRTRSGNDGNQPVRFRQCGRETGRPLSRVGRVRLSRADDRERRLPHAPDAGPALRLDLDAGVCGPDQLTAR